MSQDKNDKTKKVETTGHSWDGIEELNNPLPKWWLYFFYGTIIFGIIWTILYPAWPLVNKATQGILGYDSRKIVDDQIAEIQAQNAQVNDLFMSTEYVDIPNNPELVNFVEKSGGAVFATFCSQCHGEGANGNVGYPSLIDDDWLWGGTYADIEYTVTHGIRDEADPDTRLSEMPGFKDVLSNEEISQVVAYAQSLSGMQVEGELAKEGKAIFADNCASCHGEAGTGDRSIGAPNLTDALWLYGDSEEVIRDGILYGRKGAMPHWGDKLSPSQIKQVTAYVHSLGGGQ